MFAKTRKINSPRVVLSSVLILVITFMAFAPCLKNGFIDSWDDREYVTQNTVIQHLSPHSMARIFSTFFASTYLPLTMLSYMFDYRFFRLDPFGYHLTNLIFHLLNCLLVFWFVRLLSWNALVSFIAAIFFGVHPLHVESVAWISERKDVLYSFFFLLSMICYCHYLQTRKTGKVYWLAVVFFVFSLISKAMAITLPLLLLLTDYLKGRKYDRGMIADKIPFLIFAVCFGILGIYGQGPTLQNELLLGFFDKCLMQLFFISARSCCPQGFPVSIPIQGSRIFRSIYFHLPVALPFLF